MATTAPKRSPYKQSRIDAMLNEEATNSPLPSSNSSRVPQSFSPASSSPQPRALSSGRSRPPFVLLGIATALLCILVVFFILFRQNHTPASQARTIVSPVTKPAPAPAQASLPTVPAPVISPTTEAPKQQEPLPEPVQFRIKRSKTFEKVGPVRLRLLKANPKRNTCDLYISSSGPAYQKQAHLNKPVQIDLRDGAGSAELVVTAIKADQISGSVQQN